MKALPVVARRSIAVLLAMRLLSVGVGLPVAQANAPAPAPAPVRAAAAGLRSLAGGFQAAGGFFRGGWVPATIIGPAPSGLQDMSCVPVFDCVAINQITGSVLYGVIQR
jgi:hypothetical protein